MTRDAWIDFCLSILVRQPARLLLYYRNFGSKRLPKTTLQLKTIGLFPIRDHYYEPLFNDKSLAHPLDSDRHLPGIDLNVEAQLAFLDRMTCSDELVRLDLGRHSPALDAFYMFNGFFEAGDADFFYQLIRYIKPAKVLEIGSGHSTKIAHLALEKNQGETTQPYSHICIEPYEQPWLEGMDGVTLIRQRIEACDFDWANELDAGDLLFVDSSHMIRPQGDVLKEYLEIFPRLKAGVYIHIHDIFTPKDYPRAWIADEVRFWNEQYLLESLLSHSDRYEVVAALNFLKNHYLPELGKVCPYVTSASEPGSFYIRVKPAH